MKRNLSKTPCEHCENKHSSPFCSASAESIETLNQNKTCNSYKKGDTIIFEGSYASGIFCINEGEIKLSRKTDNGLKESIVRLVSPGDVFGYKALLTNAQYSASAIALTDAKVCFIPKETFLGMVNNDHNISMNLLSKLSNQLNTTEERITNLINKSVRERAAESILLLKSKYGCEEDGETISIQLSREDFSKIIGTTPESTIRQLSELNKKNIIELVGKKVKIKNQEKLIQIAKIYD